MDKALADTIGVRIPMPTEGAAKFFRSRCHQARKLNRESNSRIYPQVDHPQHGISEYDALILRIKTIQGKIYLYIERIPVEVTTTQRLSEVEPIPLQPDPKPEPPPKFDIKVDIPSRVITFKRPIQL
jgi:hypothetical protein